MSGDEGTSRQLRPDRKGQGEFIPKREYFRWISPNDLKPGCKLPLLQNLTPQQCVRLTNAVREHGPSNYEGIAQNLKKRVRGVGNTADVKVLMNRVNVAASELRQVASISRNVFAVPKADHYDSKTDPLLTWQAHMQPVTSFQDGQANWSALFKKISDELPAPATSGSPDFRELYGFLAEILDGQAPRNIGPEEAKMLDHTIQMIQNFAEALPPEFKAACEEHVDNINMVKLTQAAKQAAKGKSLEDTDSMPGFMNPLRVPECLLRFNPDNDSGQANSANNGI